MIFFFFFLNEISFHCVGSDESKFVDLIVEEVKKVLIKIFTDNEKATSYIIEANK